MTIEQISISIAILKSISDLINLAINRLIEFLLNNFIRIFYELQKKAASNK